MEFAIEFLHGKRIMITGGGGYLGSKLAEKLVQSEASVILFDLKFNNISGSLTKKYKNLELVKIDLLQKKRLKEVCINKQPDIIFHFAALLNRERDFANYNQLYKVNVLGTLNLLEALKTINYSGFYFSSTSEVYGSSVEVPYNEKQVLKPVSPYSLTKLMAEDLLKTHSEIYNKPYTIFRVFNFFGLDMPDSFFINQLILSLKNNEIFSMTSGEQIRDFVHIDDVVEFIIKIAATDNSKAEIINICSGEGIVIRQLAIEIAKIFEKENLLKIGALDYRINEIWKLVGDNTKLTSIVGFKLENQFEKILSSIKKIL